MKNLRVLCLLAFAVVCSTISAQKLVLSKRLGNLFIYNVDNGAQSPDNANVFTVVYATSDDGFLNVRTQPSTKGKIIVLFGG